MTGPAFEAAMRIHIQAARGSGKALRALRALSDGDVMVCSSSASKRHTQALARGLGKDIRVLTVPEFSLEAIERACQGIGNSHATVVLDHDWVERYFLAQHAFAAADMRRLEERMSACPPPKPTFKWERL